MHNISKFSGTIFLKVSHVFSSEAARKLWHMLHRLDLFLDLFCKCDETNLWKEEMILLHYNYVLYLKHNSDVCQLNLRDSFHHNFYLSVYFTPHRSMNFTLWMCLSNQHNNTLLLCETYICQFGLEIMCCFVYSKIYP